MSNIELYDLSIKDRSHPDTLISKFPSVLADKLDVIPNDILEMSDMELRRKAKIDVDAERLRISLWTEYDRASRTSTAMLMSNIYEGICSKEHFQKHVITNSFTFAYLCRAPLNLQVAAEEALLFGIEQVRDILSRPHVDENGKFNAALGKLKLEAYKELHARVKGMVVQKVEQKNLHLHADAPNTPPAPTNLKDIDARIAELEAKSQPIDVEVIDGKET